MSASLILLNLNEACGLTALLDRLSGARIDEMLAVDGGSTDGSPDLLRQYGIRVIIQEQPGQGVAHMVGAAASSGDDLVFFSPDGNEDPEDIVRLVSKLEDGFDMAIASRCLPGLAEDGGRWRPRAWANRFFSALANCIFARPGTRVSDALNGFRAIRRSSFERLQLSEAGFSLPYQMTIRAMKSGYRIAEIPTLEGPRIGGVSKARSIPVGLGHLKVLLRECVTFADGEEPDAD